MFKFNKSAGQASRLLLILAVVVLVAVLVVYLVTRMVNKPPKTPTPETPIEPVLIQDQTLNDIKITFESAIDRGELLDVSEIDESRHISSSQKDLQVTNGGKFIQVTVNARNMGKENTKRGMWDIGNIVDSEGRNFIPVGSSANLWLPVLNSCGALLKPAFDPVFCTKIYEVSKESNKFKIAIEVDKTATSKKKSSFLDLTVE